VGNLVVSQFITLDGVFQDPGGTGELDRGGWSFKGDRGPEGMEFKLQEIRAAGALLLGRVTYEGFAQAWPSMPRDETGYVDKMNSMPKFVVSATLEHADWNNSTILRGDVEDEVRAVKQQIDGDILINGSGQLVDALLEHDLIDEFRLMICPIVLGTGRRLFPDTGHEITLRLVDTIKSGDSLILTYQPARSSAEDSTSESEGLQIDHAETTATPAR
jgi:dihydrofolate reductase